MLTEREEHPVDFLPELALGVLPESAAADLRAHLERCDSCTTEFREMARVASLLPLAATDGEPPLELKDATMDRIASEPRPIGPARRRVVRPAWQWFGAAAAAGLLLLALGGATGWLIANDDESDLEGQVRAQQSIVDAAAAGTLQEISTDGASGASAILLAAPGSSDAFVRITNAPALAAGKRYQAWYIRGETPEPGEVYADATGIWLRVEEGTLADFNAVAFTIEDEDGADAPSQTPFMIIPVTETVRAR